MIKKPAPHPWPACASEFHRSCLPPERARIRQAPAGIDEKSSGAVAQVHFAAVGEIVQVVAFPAHFQENSGFELAADVAVRIGLKCSH